jgi:hypothetical protein
MKKNPRGGPLIPTLAHTRSPRGEPLVPIRNATGTKEGGFSPDSVVPVAKPELKALTNRD